MSLWTVPLVSCVSLLLCELFVFVSTFCCTDDDDRSTDLPLISRVVDVLDVCSLLSVWELFSDVDFCPIESALWSESIFTLESEELSVEASSLFCSEEVESLSLSLYESSDSGTIVDNNRIRSAYVSC